ncbi:MAG: sulfotransferase [Angustibacter sp.]
MIWEKRVACDPSADTPASDRSTLLALRSRPALLVTGVPRSGTTWVARQLSAAPGAAMTGREPMNPHVGQFALGGTISAWTRLRPPTARQARLLRLAYRGLLPRVYGRYGHRQWAGPLPSSRVVVKDPFAVLSVAAVHQVTAARPILVYRHPGAVLASYRRMGWSPDLAEVAAAVPAGERPDHLQDTPTQADGDALLPAMAWFWSLLNEVALDDLATVSGAVVVAHEDLAGGGLEAMRQLFTVCGLRWTDQVERNLARTGTSDGPAPRASSNPTRQTLHRLDRPSQQVASSWRAHVPPDEVLALERLAGHTLDRLAGRRLLVRT